MMTNVPAIREISARAASPARRSIQRHLRITLLASVMLVGGLGGWASFTTINGAVIAPGQLAVESDVKKVQHPTGGVVGALFVREGDHVKAGDILVRLDETQTRANLQIVLNALDELSARRARDEAERDGASSLTFTKDLIDRAQTDPVVAHLIDGEKRLFEIRNSGRSGQKAQLTERIGQLRQELVGLRDQASSKSREIELITQELSGVRVLRAKNLVSLSRMTTLERDASRLEGERGQLMAAQAQAEGKITETRLQILQVDQDMRTEVGKDLADIRGKWSELSEKKISARDQLMRTDLRAPQDGIVAQMTVHTVGGVITPSEPAMLIVPNMDRLVVEMKIQPQDIDHVRVGDTAILRFAAFNQRTTPEIIGTVSRVSADVVQDPKTGTSYYSARVALSDSEKAKLQGLRLVPGMPVETFIQTGDRKVISFLIKPLADQMSKTWRE